MRTLKARVVNGRLILDEPCDLPEGTELDLVVAEDEDGQEMDEAERAAVEESIERGLAEARAGKLIPAEEVLAKLRALG